MINSPYTLPRILNFKRVLLLLLNTGTKSTKSKILRYTFHKKHTPILSTKCDSVHKFLVQVKQVKCYNATTTTLGKHKVLTAD